MCYDISFKTNLKSVEEYFPGLVSDPQIELGFEVDHVLAQSFSSCPVVIFDGDSYKLKMFEWGVIADYMNTPEKIKKGRAWMCNAQSEKILGDKRSYWHRIRKKRCLIPVTGFYEHREVSGWKKKVPYFIRLKNKPLFCIAGLYHYAPFPDRETGELTGTFTVVTRAANSVMRRIHNGGANAYRMPLILSKEMEKRWLQPDLSDQEMEMVLGYEIPTEEMEYWPVFTIRSPNPRPDGLSKFEPYHWEKLPELI